MSWITGTQTEVLSVNNAVSTANTTTGTATAVLMPTGAGFTPANFALPSYGQSKSLLFRAFGVYSTTTGTNALTFGISANTTQGTYNSAAIAATTGAVNQTASITAQPWELEALITFTGAIGASATYITSGNMKMYPTSSTILTSKFSSSASTISTQVGYFWEYFALWGASSNSITVNGSVVFGLN
jgi:hypothetical protein